MYKAIIILVGILVSSFTLQPVRFPKPNYAEYNFQRLPRTGVYNVSLRPNQLLREHSVELSVDAYEEGNERHILLQLVRGTSTIIGQYYVDDLSLPDLRKLYIADLNDDGRKDFKIVTSASGQVFTVHYFFQNTEGKFEAMSFETLCPDAECSVERDLNRDGYFDTLQITSGRYQNQNVQVYNVFKAEPQYQRMRSTSTYYRYPKAFIGEREVQITVNQREQWLDLNANAFHWYPEQQTRMRLASRCKNETTTCSIN